MQAKFMAVMLREFRKNIEFNRYLERKKAETRKTNTMGTNAPSNRKPIVNDLFTADKNNQRSKKLSNSPPLSK